MIRLFSVVKDLHLRQFNVVELNLWPRRLKVAQLDLTLFVDQKVGWLNVAVHQASRVEQLHRTKHVEDESDHLLFI